MGKISTAVYACSPVRAQQRGWLRSQTEGRDVPRKSSTTSPRETSSYSLPLKPSHCRHPGFVCMPEVPCPTPRAGRACSAHAAPWGWEHASLLPLCRPLPYISKGNPEATAISV